MIDTTWKFRYISQHTRLSEILEVLSRYFAKNHREIHYEDDFRVLLRLMEAYQVHPTKVSSIRRREATLLIASGRIADAYNVLIEIPPGCKLNADDGYHELLGTLRKQQLYNALGRNECDESPADNIPLRRADRYVQQLSQEAKDHFQHAMERSPHGMISHHMRLIELHSIEGDDHSIQKARLALCHEASALEDHFDFHAQQVVLLLADIHLQTSNSPIHVSNVKEAIYHCVKMIDIDPLSKETLEIALQLLHICQEQAISICPSMLDALIGSVECIDSPLMMQKFLRISSRARVPTGVVSPPRGRGESSYI